MSKASEITICTVREEITDGTPSLAPVPNAPTHKTLISAKKWLKDNAEPGYTYTFIRQYPDLISVRQVTQLEMFTPEATGEL